MDAPYSLEEIGSMEDLEYYPNDVNFHLKALLENLIAGKCNFSSSQAWVALFDAVAMLPLASDRRASYHFLYSGLFMYNQ